VDDFGTVLSMARAGGIGQNQKLQGSRKKWHCN